MNKKLLLRFLAIALIFTAIKTIRHDFSEDTSPSSEPIKTAINNAQQNPQKSLILNSANTEEINITHDTTALPVFSIAAVPQTKLDSSIKKFKRSQKSSFVKSVCENLKKEVKPLRQNYPKWLLKSYIRRSKKLNLNVDYELSWRNTHYQDKSNNIFIVLKRSPSIKGESSDKKLQIFKEDEFQYPVEITDNKKIKAILSMINNEEMKIIYRDHQYSLNSESATLFISEKNGIPRKLELVEENNFIVCDSKNNELECNCNLHSS